MAGSPTVEQLLREASDLERKCKAEMSKSGIAKVYSVLFSSQPPDWPEEIIKVKKRAIAILAREGKYCEAAEEEADVARVKETLQSPPSYYQVAGSYDDAAKYYMMDPSARLLAIAMLKKRIACLEKHLEQSPESTSGSQIPDTRQRISKICAEIPALWKLGYDENKKAVSEFALYSLPSKSLGCNFEAGVFALKMAVPSLGANVPSDPQIADKLGFKPPVPPEGCHDIAFSHFLELVSEKNVSSLSYNFTKYFGAACVAALVAPRMDQSRAMLDELFELLTQNPSIDNSSRLSINNTIQWARQFLDSAEAESNDLDALVQRAPPTIHITEGLVAIIRQIAEEFSSDDYGLDELPAR